MKSAKPYFTEWIPVEGEPEDTDMVKYESSAGTLIERRGKMSRYAGSYIQKVKLYLCSRDIQEEDYLVEGRVHVYFDNHNNIPPFKVIGEVSPEATWVTAGMEFDEDEWKKEEGFFDTVRIKIKGPCGHFH